MMSRDFDSFILLWSSTIRSSSRLSILSIQIGCQRVSNFQTLIFLHLMCDVRWVIPNHILYTMHIYVFFYVNVYKYERFFSSLYKKRMLSTIFSLLLAFFVKKRKYNLLYTVLLQPTSTEIWSITFLKRNVNRKKMQRVSINQIWLMHQILYETHQKTTRQKSGSK